MAILAVGFLLKKLRPTLIHDNAIVECTGPFMGKIVKDKEGKNIIVLGKSEIDTEAGKIEIKELHAHEYKKDKPGKVELGGETFKTIGHFKATIRMPDGQTKSGIVGYILGKKNISEVIEEARERMSNKDRKK